MTGPRFTGSLQSEYLGWAAMLKLANAPSALTTDIVILVFITFFRLDSFLFPLTADVRITWIQFSLHPCPSLQTAEPNAGQVCRTDDMFHKDVIPRTSAFLSSKIQKIERNRPRLRITY